MIQQLIRQMYNSQNSSNPTIAQRLNEAIKEGWRIVSITALGTSSEVLVVLEREEA